MKEKMKLLKEQLAEIADLRAASAVLGWDQLVNMPEGAAVDRGEQIATIEKIQHIKSTSDELGKLLIDLTEYAKQLDPDCDDARLVKVAQRDFNKQSKIPTEYIVDFARESTVAQSV